MATPRETLPIAGEASGRDFRGWIEILTGDVATTGMLRAEGWVFSPANEIDQIRAVVGQESWTGQYGLPRPDVGTIFPEISHAVFSGFTIFIPVPAKGTFELRLQAQNGTEKFHTFFRQQISLARPRLKRLVRSSLQNLYRYEGLQRGYVCWIDEPVDWNKLARRFQVIGWCFTKSGEKIEAIRARVGTREFPGNFGFFRQDVAASCGDRETTFESGFEVAVEAPRRRAMFRLEVRHQDHQWKEIFARPIRAPLFSFGSARDESVSAIGNYEAWIRMYDTLSRSDRRKIRAHIRAFPKQPLISILMPVYNPAPHHLRDALRSVCAQLYPNWQLCIVDDASTATYVRPILSREARRDSRISVKFREKNGGIAAASNDALALAQGDWVALMDDDDVLAPTALYFVAHETNQHPGVQLIYSDEDKLDTTGGRTNPHFKPDWNWLLFLAQNFVSHLSVFHADLIKSLGFRAGFEGSQDYDLVLRSLEKIRPPQVRHIPRVLYHWRMAQGSAALSLHAKPEARAAAIKAVQEHLDRTKIAATVTRSGIEDFQRVRFELSENRPTVSLIIPTRDRVEVLRPGLESIVEKTTYRPFDILLIDNGSIEHATLQYLDEVSRDPRIRVLRLDEEFNFSRLNNFGVSQTQSEFVALLNNDLRVVTPNWLEEMVSHSSQPGVGAVGARLLFPDGRIQHAGVIVGAGAGVAEHAHKRLPRDNHGYFARAMLAQELSAVTAACMLVRRNLYLEVGGFDEEHLKIAFNDIDFCLRIRKHGYRIIYTPYAEFYHDESASRGLEDNLSKYWRFNAEADYVKATWGETLEHDPYYNPNLSLVSTPFTLAFPPRVTKPWLGT